MKKLIALALLAILLAPVAAAEVVTVRSPLDSDGRMWQKEYSRTSGVSLSFAFDSDVYNTTATTQNNDTLKEGQLYVHHYPVDPNTASFWGSLFSKINPWHDTKVSSRVYETRLTLNEDHRVTFATTFSRASDRVTWDVCTSLTYQVSTDIYNAPGNCMRVLSSEAPNYIRHSFVFGDIWNASSPLYKTNDGDTDGIYAQAIIPTFFDTPTFVRDADLGLPAGRFPNPITAANLVTTNVAGDETRTVIQYRFTTYANHGDTVQKATAKDCKMFFGLVKCDTIDSIFNSVFGFVDKVMAFVFGRFPGGDKIVSFSVQVMGIFIGIPIYLMFMFLSTPVQTTIVLWWLGLLLGTVKYATSQTESINVIWDTPYNGSVKAAKALVRVGKWVYETTLSVVKFIAGLIPGAG